MNINITPLFLDWHTPEFLKYPPQHFTLDNFKTLGYNINDFDYSFAIVRNPYKRLESEYFYNIHIEEKTLYSPTFSINHIDIDKISAPNFSDWIIENLNRYKEDNFHRDGHLIPQYKFFDDSIKNIFIFENGMDNIIKEISKQIQIELPLEHRYRTDKFPIEWSKEAIDLTNEIYEIDFEKFNYEKK